MAIIFRLIGALCEVLSIAILVRAIFSWVSPRPNAFTDFLVTITEPVLAPLRRVVPRLGPVDFTPLVAIVLLQIIARILR
ncbi:MAG: YggT family protein [Chloroflexi bacterium]|nr:YggT family protein [Chloroflexota bacterium]